VTLLRPSLSLMMLAFPYLALAGCRGAAGEVSRDVDAQARAHPRGAPPLPDPGLAVPAGHALALSVDAAGVQIYTCTATGGGHAWVFTAPRADLFETRGGERQLVGKHYAGPIWELADGGAVKGARVSGTTPDPTAIPWLLLSAADHTGSGRLSRVSYVQRLQTVGGLAPSGAACGAGNVGATYEAGYSARYDFYVPAS